MSPSQRWGLAAVALLAGCSLAGCSPSLGDAPFACAAGGACPDGYTCRATECVRVGAHLPAARPERVVWINAAEMHWAASAKGGAVLVVNDGFTPGAHGIYEIAVSAAGDVAVPRPLLHYDDGFPRSSSVVELDDGRWGIATLRFPDVTGDDLTLEVLAADREAPEGATPAVESLYTSTTAYLGGFEPAYVGASSDGKAIDVAWTQPEGGGRVEVLHLEKGGAMWSPTRQGKAALPVGILPLSGDCLLWRISEDTLALRVGFQHYAIGTVAPTGQVGPLAVLKDTALYAWSDARLLLRFGAHDGVAGISAVSFVLADTKGKDLAVDDGWFLQDTTEPYTATPSGDGALIAPLAKDPTFATLGVGFRSPTKGLVTVASIDRESSDELYSARAFAAGGKVYLAWTSFHESLMDLWIAVADAPDPSGGAAPKAHHRPTPRRAMGFRIPSSPPRRLP